LPVFVYKARSRSKTGTFEGEIEAPTKNDAAAKLFQQGYLPSSVEEKSEKEGLSSLLNPAKLKGKFEKITIEDLILFTSQMSTLFKAGLPLMSIFDGLIEQATKTRLKHALTDIRAKVEDGATMSEAMQHYPDLFSGTFRSMVNAGEVSGTLDESLERVTHLMEREFETENRLKEVTRYPKIVVGAVTVAVTILMSFVVPKFITIFEKAKLDLPIPTKILVFINYLFQNYWYIGLLAVAGAYFAFTHYISTKRGRYKWHYYTLKIPVIGDVISKIKFGQFCNVMANLLKSGIPILDAIEVAAKAAGNDYLMTIFKKVEDSVREGSGMAEPMREYDIIPKIVVQMIAAGEHSGALDDMLLKVAQYFNEDADRSIKKLSSLIEPVLIFVLGGIVLFLALAIFLPMWDMTKMARPK